MLDSLILVNLVATIRAFYFAPNLGVCSFEGLKSVTGDLSETLHRVTCCLALSIVGYDLALTSCVCDSGSGPKKLSWSTPWASTN